MNAFHEHHKDSIRFGYRCFDRFLRNARIQPFQQPERMIGFFDTNREGKPVTRSLLTEGRRDDFLDPLLQASQGPSVVAILKAREPARILIAQRE